jgi:predicted nucleotidyltransferase
MWKGLPEQAGRVLLLSAYSLRKVCRYAGCTEIFVFGSTARGDYKEDSDLDIAVRGVSAEKFFAVYGELMSRLSRPVHLANLDLQERFGKQLLSTSELRRVA